MLIRIKCMLLFRGFNRAQFSFAKIPIPILISDGLFGGKWKRRGQTNRTIFDFGSPGENYKEMQLLCANNDKLQWSRFAKRIFAKWEIDSRITLNFCAVVSLRFNLFDLFVFVFLVRRMPKTLMNLICFLVSLAHWAEHSLWTFVHL